LNRIIRINSVQSSTGKGPKSGFLAKNQEKGFSKKYFFEKPAIRAIQEKMKF